MFGPQKLLSRILQNTPNLLKVWAQQLLAPLRYNSIIHAHKVSLSWLYILYSSCWKFNYSPWAEVLIEECVNTRNRIKIIGIWNFWIWKRKLVKQNYSASWKFGPHKLWPRHLNNIHPPESLSQKTNDMMMDPCEKISLLDTTFYFQIWLYELFCRTIKPKATTRCWGAGAERAEQKDFSLQNRKQG